MITIFGNSVEHVTFTISDGEMFYVPSGYIYHIENLNEESTTEFVIGLSHKLPEHFNLSYAFGAM